MDKPWIEVEMEETKALIRKKLEELNDMDVDDIGEEELGMLAKSYGILESLMSLKKELKTMTKP